LRIALPFALLLALAACARPPPAEPAAAYRLFLQHVARARTDDAVHLLDEFDAPTREALTRQATAASQAIGAPLSSDPVIQLLQGPPPVTAEGITVVEQTADRATLEVTLDAGPGGRVVMVREAGRWRVHLVLPAVAPSAPAP
jgi:hypothetical protein